MANHGLYSTILSSEDKLTVASLIVYNVRLSPFLKISKREKPATFTKYY